MKTWLVRFVSLYAFNVVVLLLVGILPGVRVGWAALWGALILTAATIWVKPAITKLFRGMTAKSARQRTKAGEQLVQGGLVLVVEIIVWVLVVALSGVNVSGWFWGWVLPPIALLVAWAIYAAIDDKVEAHAGALYDRAANRQGRSTDAAPAVPQSPESAAGRRELKDGLTDEQRRMLDSL